MLDREIGLACPNTEGPPQHPRPREAWVECKRAVDQCNLGPDILAEKGQRKGGVREDTRVVAGGFHSLPRARRCPGGGSSPDRRASRRVARGRSRPRRAPARNADRADGLFERAQRGENPLARGEGKNSGSARR